MADLLRSDPVATQRRYEQLASYMDEHVLSEHGFCCVSGDSCRASLGAADAFAARQLSHVGHHYDLSVGDQPFRILVLGMDTGRPDGGVTLDRRREQIYDLIREPFSRRNPHMRGTTLALLTCKGERTGATDRRSASPGLPTNQSTCSMPTRWRTRASARRSGPEAPEARAPPG